MKDLAHINRASQCRRNTGLPSRRQVELGRSVEPGGSEATAPGGRRTVRVPDGVARRGLPLRPFCLTTSAVEVQHLASSFQHPESNRGGSELEFPVNHSKIRADQKSNRNFLSLWFSRTASLPGRVPDAFAGRGIFSSHSPLVTRHCISNRHSCRLELPVTLTKHSTDTRSNRHSIRPTICAQSDAHPQNACLGWRQESSRII